MRFIKRVNLTQFYNYLLPGDSDNQIELLIE